MNLCIVVAIIACVGMLGCFGLYYWSKNTYANYEDGLTITAVVVCFLTIFLVILTPIIVLCQPKEIISTEISYPIVDGVEMKEYPEYKVTVRQEWGHIYWEEMKTMTPFEYIKATGGLRKDNENDN